MYSGMLLNGVSSEKYIFLVHTFAENKTNIYKNMYIFDAELSAIYIWMRKQWEQTHAFMINFLEM